MASGLFDYGQDLVLDVMFGQSQTVPATYWFALLRSAPTEDMTGSELDEPYFIAPELGEDPPEEVGEEPPPEEDVPTGYGRVSKTNNDTNWADAETSYKRNATSIAFPEATQDWGLISHVALVDAETEGNAIAWVELVTPVEVYQGAIPTLEAESLILTASTPEDIYDDMDRGGEEGL